MSHHMTNVGRSSFSNGTERIRVQEYQPAGYWKEVEYDATDFTKHEVRSYHVSCESYQPSSFNGRESLGGIVLYLKDGKTDWHCNGVHCKIGYIILKRLTKDGRVHGSEHVESSNGAIHGAIYKSVFGEEPADVVGSGFAYKPGQGWKYSSGVFNANDIGAAGDLFHTKFGDWNIDREMGQTEIEAIEEALRKWCNYGLQDGQDTYPSGDKVVVYAKTKVKKTKQVWQSTPRNDDGCIIL